MSKYAASTICVPPGLPEILASVASLAIPNLIVHASPLQSIAEFSLLRPGDGFTRTSEHFVIADYLICLVIVAVDLGATSSNYGRVVGFADGEHWYLADSLVNFVERLKAEREYAVWGIPNRPTESC